MKRDISLYINDIIESCNLIAEYISTGDEDTFKQDMQLQDAIIRRIEIIGEAIQAIPDTIKDKYPEIKWAEARGMRNYLVHDYFGIRLETLWQTIIHDIPDLKAQIQKVSIDE